MLQVGDKIRVTEADDKPRNYTLLDGAMFVEFNGTEFLGCMRNGRLGVKRWPIYALQQKLEKVEAKVRQRNNIDCMVEQIFAENLV